MAVLTTLATAVATALVAAGAATFGVSLTRLFGLLSPAGGVLLFVVFAMSGLATGALLAHRLGWLPSRRPTLAATGAAAGGALVVVTTAVVVLGAAVNSTIGNALLAYATYAALGMSLAAVYAAAPRHAAALCGAQLFGAGIASLASVAVVDRSGPLDASLAAAFATGVGGLLLAGAAVLAARVAGADRGGRAAADEDDLEFGDRLPVGRVVITGLDALSVLVALVALPLDLSLRWLSLDPTSVASPKPLFASIRDPDLREKVVYTRWDSTGRTDVTEPATGDDVKWVYMDGNVAGLMYKEGGGTAAQALTADIGYLPFSLPGPRARVLVIGAGTGQEVRMALAAGASEVVAAEVSPGLIDAVRHFGAFNGNVFDHPKVRVVNQDGRTFLRRSGEQFDLIYLTLATGGTAQAGGPLSGSHLYTIEAFDEYVAHLRQDGRLAVKLRDEQELFRAFNTAFQTFTRRGATPLDAIRHLVAINNQPLAERAGGGVLLPLLLARKTAFLEDEARATFDALRQTPYLPLFMPHVEIERQSPLTAFAVEEVGPAVLEAQAPFDIRPATDTRPFFAESGKGVPWTVLFVAVLAGMVVGVAALFTRRPGIDAIESSGVADAGVEEAAQFLEDDVPWRFVGFAALAALGFGVLPVALAHRLPTLVGHPPLAPAIAYGAFALGGVLGSILVLRARRAALRPVVGWAALAGGLLAVALLELYPMAVAAFGTWGPLARVAVAVALVAPLGVCFGVPFPAAVQLLGDARRGGWAALLWAASAIAGAIAALLALTFGIGWSFSYAMFIGAACLFGVFMIAGLRLLVAEPAESTAAGHSGSGAVSVPDYTAFRRPADTAPPAA